MEEEPNKHHTYLSQELGPRPDLPVPPPPLHPRGRRCTAELGPCTLSKMQGYGRVQPGYWLRMSSFSSVRINHQSAPNSASPGA